MNTRIMRTIVTPVKSRTVLAAVVALLMLVGVTGAAVPPALAADAHVQPAVGTDDPCGSDGDPDEMLVSGDMDICRLGVEVAWQDSVVITATIGLDADATRDTEVYALEWMVGDCPVVVEHRTGGFLGNTTMFQYGCDSDANVSIGGPAADFCAGDVHPDYECFGDTGRYRALPAEATTVDGDTVVFELRLHELLPADDLARHLAAGALEQVSAHTRIGDGPLSTGGRGGGRGCVMTTCASDDLGDSTTPIDVPLDPPTDWSATAAYTAPAGDGSLLPLERLHRNVVDLNRATSSIHRTIDSASASFQHVPGVGWTAAIPPGGTAATVASTLPSTGPADADMGRCTFDMTVDFGYYSGLGDTETLIDATQQAAVSCPDDVDGHVRALGSVWIVDSGVEGLADTVILHCPDRTPDAGSCAAEDALDGIGDTLEQRGDLAVPVSTYQRGQEEPDFHGNGSELTFMAWYFVTIPELGGQFVFRATADTVQGSNQMDVIWEVLSSPGSP